MRTLIKKRLGVDVEMPPKYDNRYRVNFSLLLDTSQRRDKIDDIKGAADHLAVVRKALHLFEDFNQKKRFAKLAKFREDQRKLPIFQYQKEILQAVSSNSVVVVAGDTGCGKSTQVPQYLVRAGFSKIACTQPRRISAMSLCRRVSQETFNGYGSSIAFQIRFDTTKTSATRILFLTEGLLLRQLASDPDLHHYDVVIVDEVHERHLTGDFVLGILKQLVERRPKLRVICMSATINVQLFSHYFAGAPVIQIPGRLFPITVSYLPPPSSTRHPDDLPATTTTQKEGEGQEKKAGKAGGRWKGARDGLDVQHYIRALSRIEQQYPDSERGDVLIFVAGINEIMALTAEIKQYAAKTKKWITLALHSSLSVDEQDKVFDVAAEGTRKCIVSTNIAETSVTIDAIRWVIDSGKAKEMGYDAQTHLHSLQEFWISKASAEQRKGRAGRTGPGMCFRMYSEAEYGHMLEYTVPEIQRTPLHSVCLSIKAMQLGNPRTFPFVEPPPLDMVEATMDGLKLQGALNDDDSLNALGVVLSRLPVDINMGKMLIFATLFHVLDPILTIAASLSVQSPFLRVNTEDAAAVEARHKFDSDLGDCFTLLNAYDQWLNIKAQQKENSRKWAKRHSLEEQRLYEMSKLRQQFQAILSDSGLLQLPDKHVEEGREGMARPHDDRRDMERWQREAREKRRQLRMMQMVNENRRGRRVLRLDDDVDPDGEEEADGQAGEGGEAAFDVRDMDFKLSHDMGDLCNAAGRTLSADDVNLIKFIVASGLYPNVAVPDEANANRKDSELQYHTRHVSFVNMHPTSVYVSGASRTPGLLTDALVFVTLLETQKPFLTNSMRIPPLHVLLLVAHTVDTSAECTRLVVDDWLEFRLPSRALAEKLLLIVHQLRLMLQSFLTSRLADAVRNVPTKEYDPPPLDDHVRDALPRTLRKIRDTDGTALACTELELAHKLSGLMATAVPFKMTRIKPSSLAAMFHVVGALETSKEPPVRQDDPMAAVEALELARSRQGQFESRKGGVRVCCWLRYGSVREDSDPEAGLSTHMRRHWDCPVCHKHLIVGTQELRDHQQQCLPSSVGSSSSSPVSKTQSHRVKTAAREALMDGGVAAKRPRTRQPDASSAAAPVPHAASSSTHLTLTPSTPQRPLQPCSGAKATMALLEEESAAVAGTAVVTGVIGGVSPRNSTAIRDCGERAETGRGTPVGFADGGGTSRSAMYALESKGRASVDGAGERSRGGSSKAAGARERWECPECFRVLVFTEAEKQHHLLLHSTTPNSRGPAPS